MKLSVRHGCFSYDKPVLTDVNFSLEKGEIMAVLGMNGIGKTTLLKCVTGLEKWQKGESLIDGRAFSQMRGRDLWKKISYVPQARANNTLYTGQEMALLGRSARLGLLSSPSAEDRAIVDGVFAMLHIESLRDKRCSRMSGGETQMVMIARALAAQPEIIVLDEPESGLDFKNQLIILETLRSLAADGLTCVFNTHYPAHALRVAEKTLLLGADERCLFADSREAVTVSNMRDFFGVETHMDEYVENGKHFFSITPLSILDEEREARFKSFKTDEDVS